MQRRTTTHPTLTEKQNTDTRTTIMETRTLKHSASKAKLLLQGTSSHLVIWRANFCFAEWAKVYTRNYANGASLIATTKTIEVPTSDRKNRKVNHTPMEINDATQPRVETSNCSTRSNVIAFVMNRHPTTNTTCKYHADGKYYVQTPTQRPR